jgi:hypothetical protein
MDRRQPRGISHALGYTTVRFRRLAESHSAPATTEA